MVVWEMSSQLSTFPEANIHVQTAGSVPSRSHAEPSAKTCRGFSLATRRDWETWFCSWFAACDNLCHPCHPSANCLSLTNRFRHGSIDCSVATFEETGSQCALPAFTNPTDHKRYQEIVYLNIGLGLLCFPSHFLGPPCFNLFVSVLDPVRDPE